MNREILFRGKEINNEKWHYGDLLRFGNKRYINICPRFVDEYIVEEDKIALYSFGNFIEVIPETIGRYTGLTDRNGVKIFEGDIIKGKGKNVFVVEYNQNIASFITKGFGTLACPCMNIGTMEYYEAVGNIHDNPELLGGIEND